jgi:hypothetical protein
MKHLRSLLIYNELGHGIGNLLEQDRSEARVKSTNDTLFLQKAGETTQKSVSERGLGNLLTEIEVRNRSILSKCENHWKNTQRV